jgi:replication-associated recombination protein RarA
MIAAMTPTLAKVLSVENQYCRSDVEGEKESVSNLRNVVERLKSLETERRNLLLEIEELKKMAESKTRALEGEISMLREEVKSLRVLLGAEEAEPEFNPKKKK